MKESIQKVLQKHLRQARVRSKIRGTSLRPRLSVFISNRNVNAQIIDDSTHKTLVSVTTVGSKTSFKSMNEKAGWVGEQIGKKARAAKIKNVVFDRGSRLYHGRIKTLADKAREAGLEF